MKVLVTGGAGFIGSNFANYLINQDEIVDKVTVVDALTYAGRIENINELESSSNFNFVKGDIRDQILMDKLIGDHDFVINFAAESHVDRSISEPDSFLSTNILGTGTLLNSLRNHKKVKFLHVSTDEVYGSISDGSWDEEFQLKPNSPYSSSKAASDLLVLAYGKTFDLDVMVSRCSNNFGPKQYPEKFIPLAITNLLRKKKVPVYGDGKNIRDWLFVEDHVRALLLLLQHGRSGEIYNIGGGTEMTNLDLVEFVLRFMDADHSSIEFVEDRLAHDRRYSVNWNKIKAHTGYEPKYNFEESLKLTINWYKDNFHWWNNINRPDIN